MERKQWPNGKHLLEFEPPDIFHCYVRGPVLVPEAEEALQILREEVVPQVGDVYFLVHTGDVGDKAMPSETRKYFAAVKPVWKGTVLIGGTPIARLAANAFIHAMTILSSKHVPMRVVKTDEEAIAYVKELRSNQAKSNKS